MAKLTISPFSPSSRVYILGQKINELRREVIRIICAVSLQTRFASSMLHENKT